MCTQVISSPILRLAPHALARHRSLLTLSLAAKGALEEGGALSAHHSDHSLLGATVHETVVVGHHVPRIMVVQPDTWGDVSILPFLPNQDAVQVRCITGKYYREKMY